LGDAVSLKSHGKSRKLSFFEHASLALYAGEGLSFFIVSGSSGMLQKQG